MLRRVALHDAVRSLFDPLIVCSDQILARFRYLICIIGGTKNPHRSEVAQDIVNAILKSPAKDKTPAMYWSQEEQEDRLKQAFDKWAAVGGIWSAAAQKVRRSSLCALTCLITRLCCRLIMNSSNM